MEERSNAPAIRERHRVGRNNQRLPLPLPLPLRVGSEMKNFSTNQQGDINHENANDQNNNAKDEVSRPHALALSAVERFVEKNMAMHRLRPGSFASVTAKGRGW